MDCVQSFDWCICAVSRRDHDTAHNDPKEFGTLTFPPLLSLVFHLFSNKRRNALGTLNLGYKASRYKP